MFVICTVWLLQMDFGYEYIDREKNIIGAADCLLRLKLSQSNMSIFNTIRSIVTTYN